jgi:hypothetical protein
VRPRLAWACVVPGSPGGLPARRAGGFVLPTVVVRLMNLPGPVLVNQLAVR